MKVLKILKFTRICMENHASVTGWQSCFSYSNTPNFWWALQWLLLRHRRIHRDVIVYIFAHWHTSQPTEDVAVHAN